METRLFVLTKDNKQIKIRLEGIDCPESNQDFGNRAKQAVSELCFGKEVEIVKSGVDRYGRTLGYVIVGKLNVNKELLKQGLAWHYKYYNKDEELAKLEHTASLVKLFSFRCLLHNKFSLFINIQICKPNFGFQFLKFLIG